ncbi:transposase [Imperialibacter sp. EC-SDR9]|nr:transposase [Imperialibacter sp. 75]CAD5261143.1 transposase [Imperialibacter sp. 89]VVT25026.1 transposase [Imperialibacter sp. EC-SDR9]
MYNWLSLKFYIYMMSNFKKLSHVLYRCDYHIVWTPKYRFKVLEGLVKQQLEKDLLMLLEWKACEKKELNIQIDHVHLIVSVPPKVSISQLMGVLKGKTAIKTFKSYPQLKQKPYWGNHFWSRGYCVDTIGLDEEKIRRYVKYQEKQEKLEEQQKLDFGPL